MIPIGLAILLVFCVGFAAYATGMLVEQTRQHRIRAAEAQARREAELRRLT
jgi:hypothetical protein